MPTRRKRRSARRRRARGSHRERRLSVVTAPAPRVEIGRRTKVRPKATVIVLGRATVQPGAPSEPDGGPMRRPRPMCVDGYVRSDSGRRSFASPTDIDTGQIVRWAHARGWHVRGLFAEPCSMPVTDEGSLLRVALERVESHETDGLVVARLTHLGRSLSDAVRALERIAAAGGTFVSVRDGIDFETSTGRVILRLLVSIVDW